MREATARAEFQGVRGFDETESRLVNEPVRDIPTVINRFSPEQFEREQVRRLVRQVFFVPAVNPVHQVAFSAIDSQTDVYEICTRVGEEIAATTKSDVAVVGGSQESDLRNRGRRQDENNQAPNAESSRSRANLWFMPANCRPNWHLGGAMQSYLQDIRREFELSIVEAPPLAISEEAWALAEWADGLILVLSAHTRRVAAVKIREMLAEARVRVLGVVLRDREFPIPERIYRRL